MKKRMLILFTVLTMFSPATALADDTCSVIPVPSAATAGEADAVMPLSDVIVWKVRIVDGKTYRRKYNVTKKQYIGEWELVS